MKEIQRVDLEAPIRAALEEVEAVLASSHCPYSGLSVAAGLIGKDGLLATGVNYESASYGLTLCAERTAMARAQTEGDILSTTGLVLAAMRADASPDHPPLTPCGACRQWLSELSERLGHDFPVYSFWKAGPAGLVTSARNLLPKAFL